MSNEQGDEPTVAEYTRVDASKLPTDPAGQEAAVEGTAAAHGYTLRRRGTFERIADDLNRRGVPRETPAGALVTQMLTAFNEFERETAAARAAKGDTNPFDLAPYADVHDLAEQYTHARARTQDPADLERFLDNLADDLDLADVKALRTAAAAVADAMGRIALAHREQGMSPDQIAAETGYTASRIAQFIRQEKERRADAQWDAFLTVEQHDGAHWQGLSDESLATTESPTDLARRLLATARERLPSVTLRVRVWRFGESEGPHLAEAIHTHDDHMPDDQ
ncbi:hypothetical protein [Streptomyces silvensis]|uniref:Uncharacterized protein n=1 Tax=Streptomyces silvensis TaxID=1765722 RepID=A0A0W7X9X5_9ACTN|nr:hypothetical protein [Streptomyces silvensis]KUF19578.1 hypothetical protein AT728_04180 [Streptomyces silvensis]